MKNLGPWRTEDFESLSWHDAHVHGFSLRAIKPDNGSADLVLDIDFILEWDKADRGFQFTVCKAELIFHDVFGLKFSLDYVSQSAGMCSFSIHGIEREQVEYITGLKGFRWRIPINWPKGSIEFEAPGFTQTLIGEPIIQSGQRLSSDQR
jgi:hypothetical protein